MDRRETWFSNRRFGVVLAGVLVLAGCAGSPPAAPPLPPPGTAFRDCAACPEMMVVPAGTYLMGSPPGEKDRDADEGPRHRVTFAAPFALARHALTRRQFAAFVQATGQRTEGGCETWNGTRWASDPAVSWRDPGYDQGPEHPVVCISWVDARSYVGWLRAKTGRPYRLPSEAEWEYASRAGDDGPAPWSSMPERACALANVHDRTGARAIASDWEHYDCDDGHPRTSPVGAFPANPFGPFDVLGIEQSVPPPWGMIEWKRQRYSVDFVVRSRWGSVRRPCEDDSTGSELIEYALVPDPSRNWPEELEDGPPKEPAHAACLGWACRPLIDEVILQVVALKDHPNQMIDLE